MTTYGSAIFRDHVPDRTAAAVERLEAAGYSVVGKTNLHEFAYGITSENEHFGSVRNPLALGRVAGGSSGGSGAALAAAMCDAALGTDSAGSIRIPAACCGVAGFKPTHGRVPIDGVFPLAPSFDTAGPMARTVGECAAAMRALDQTLPTTPVALADLRVGIAWLEAADPLVRARVAEAASLFTERRTLELPFGRELHPVFMREVADVHRSLFAERRDLYGESVRIKVERCLAVESDAYEAALAARERYHEAWSEAVRDVDLLLTPTLPCVAPPAGIGDLALRETLIRFTFPISALGWPAVSLPCGPAEDGLPASVQLTAPSAKDDFVLGAGIALERALASPV